jgi:hypothetical protein
MICQEYPQIRLPRRRHKCRTADQTGIIEEAGNVSTAAQFLRPALRIMSPRQPLGFHHLSVFFTAVCKRADTCSHSLLIDVNDQVQS